jgi:hypothetical protein
MGYNQRNDEIGDNVERMRREREAYADALATVEKFNARLTGVHNFMSPKHCRAFFRDLLR